MSKLTLIGMYNYLNASGDDLFLNLALPTGIDKDSVIDTILLRGGEFEVIFSDPYFLKSSLMTFSKKWHWTFDRWLKAINIEYNPLENYDRIEESTDIEVNNGKNSSNRTDSRTDNLLQKTNIKDSGKVENTVSAFDSNSYSPKDETITDMNNDATTSNTGTQSQTGTINGTTENNINKTHNLHIHGNIGVLTSQQMLQSELDIAMFNLYDKIADIFLQEYVIPIY